MTIQVDRRFGEWNQFGTTNQFGASTLEADLAWGVEIDWDGNGIFDGSNEARRMCGIDITRGRWALLQSEGNGYENIPTGTAVITLWNDDGRYDGWNADSPLYPNVSPGKDVRIRVRNLQASGEVIEDVFYGVISDIVPTSYDERPQVNISMEDGWSYLRNYAARVAIQEGISIDTALGLILDSVGWPSRWGRNLGVSSDTIRYWWASGDKSAGVECEDAANSFFGCFFIAADGSARFVPRTSIGAAVVEFDQSHLYKDIQNPQPWIHLRNVMQLKVHPRDESATTVLFAQVSTESPIEIPAGESFSFFVDFTYEGQSVPALSLVTPVANTDYKMWTNSNGTGTEKTAECSVSVTNLGKSGLVSITNNSAVTVYPINPFQIRGVAVYEKNSSDAYYPSDPSTVTNPRKFFMDLLWQQNLNRAQSICDAIGPFLEAGHPFPTVKVESNFEKQFGKELFDIAVFTSGRLGIGGQSFKIGGIRHQSLDENCQRIQTTFSLEPYFGGGGYGAFPLTFGESIIGY